MVEEYDVDLVDPFCDDEFLEQEYYAIENSERAEEKDFGGELDELLHEYKMFTGTVGSMLSQAGYTVRATGNIFSINGTEFMVTDCDGKEITVWSPPWGEFYGAQKENLAMLAVALGLVNRNGGDE